MRRRIALTALAFSFIAGNALNAQQNCRHCVQRLDLDASRWQCLLRQAEARRTIRAKYLFIKLEAKDCNERYRGGGGIIIPVIEETPPQPSRIYTFSMQQINCLLQKKDKASRQNGRFLFDVILLCAS